MMKQLVQGVCGGLRWLQTKELAEFISHKAQEAKKADKSRRVTHGRKRMQRGVKGGRCMEEALGPSSSREKFALPKERLVLYDVLDCTLGRGNHAGAILENGKPYTRVVAVDCDPEVALNALELAEEFGDDRIRFYCCKMSSVLSMFGEKSFDAVMIDPGASEEQLENPARGFLLDDENDHSVDMRYGPQTQTSLLSYLNSVPQGSLASALAEYKLLTPEQSIKFARIVRKCRPFTGSGDLLKAIECGDSGIPLDSWVSNSSRRKASMSWEFITSLRCIINDEKRELTDALRNAFMLLRENGRLIVFSRLSWEEELINSFITNHPHGVLAYTEDINSEGSRLGHSRHTKMWVSAHMKNSFVLQNMVQPITDVSMQESHTRWMTGLHAGQTYGFPANNFTFENLDASERKAMRNNLNPPPFDYDEEK